MSEHVAAHGALLPEEAGGTTTVRGGSSFKEITPELETIHCQSTIRSRTLAKLRSNFEVYGHRPSKEMWHALSDITGVMEAMADGTCHPSFYLSSLDPGVGKTQTLIETIRTITGDKVYEHVGIVVFLSRLDEIKTLVEEGGLKPDQYATLTSDKGELREAGLGQDRADEAQVLFTTQKRLELEAIYGVRFADCSAFHFRGQPRQVRVWDESLVPGRSITVDRLAIAALFEPLSNPYPRLVECLEDIFEDLKALPDRGTYDMPDFAVDHDVGPLEAVAALPNASDYRAEVVQSLWFLSGRRVTVRHDRKKRLFIDYQDFLPDDLTPLLILDASGRVRTTYDFWRDRRGDLIKLRTGHKRYDNLVINVWARSGSKGGWKRDGPNLLEGIVEMVNAKPNEDWLIVYHRVKSTGFDLPRHLQSRFIGSPDRLKFLTWGNHQATNAYKDVANVILAGTLFYPSPSIEALGRAAAKHPSSKGAFLKGDCDIVESGEHNHNILQALCRGSVRGCRDGICHPCTAYVIASKRSGIPQALSGVFPKATIQTWGGALKRRVLIGKPKQAFDFIVSCLRDEPNALLSFQTVAKAIGYDTKNLKKIRKTPSFIAALKAESLIEVSGGRGCSGFAHCTNDLQ